MTNRMRLCCALLLFGGACSSSTALSGDAMTLCTQSETKRAVCNGDGDACQLALDGGSFCPDMAGTTPAPDPADVQQCATSVMRGNPVYWNAYFACYLDGKTSSCDGDRKACQETAVSQTPARDIDQQMASACNAYYDRCPGGDLNPDDCVASIMASTEALQQAIVCLQGACDAIKDCLHDAL